MAEVFFSKTSKPKDKGNPKQQYRKKERPHLVHDSQERKADDFKAFRGWLEAHGPFGVIVDGANLALFGQNNPDGGFDFRQIEAALGHARARHPELKPLVVRPPPWEPAPSR